jgi:formylglycine-generating enzyme required for sulfatase activity
VRRITLVFGILVLLLVGASAALAEKRVALVIGNDNYITLPDLNNARKDAKGMAAKLKELGFEVILKLDAGRRETFRALADFEGRLLGGGMGLVFYAGHGIQADGRNYLIPADARVEIEEDLRSEALDSAEILTAMERAGNSLNILVLDACRDNPLPKRHRSAARGLAVVHVPKGAKGTAILYSAGPGQTAEDGPKGGHGVFTGELLRALDKPGLKLEDVFKRVMRRVLDLTNGRQRPWNLASVEGDFYFRSGEDVARAPAPATDKEALFWQSVKDSNRAQDFEAYLQQFPQGTFAPLARSRLDALKEQQVAVVVPPKPSYQVEEREEPYVLVRNANIRTGPGTKHDKLTTLKAGTEVTVTGKVKGQKWYRIAYAGGTGFVYGSLIQDKAGWEKAQMAVVAPRPSKLPAKPEAEPAVGVYLTPGKVFRDCPGCPEMVVIPAGSFRMGDLSGDGRRVEKPVHDVTIQTPFAVGKYEVTQVEWRTFMGSNPSHYKGDHLPVSEVNWFDVKSFLRKLSAASGKTYRLLSEAEWEYMARAGTTSKYPWGDGISMGQARYGSANDGPVPVGSFSPNAFGVYDTAGNISEWVEDCFHTPYTGAPTDGSAWTQVDEELGDTCTARHTRGGNFSERANSLRSANRTWQDIEEKSWVIGIRVARDLSNTQAQSASVEDQQVAVVTPPKIKTQPDVGVSHDRPPAEIRTKTIFMALSIEEVFRRHFNLARKNGNKQAIKYGMPDNYAREHPKMVKELAIYDLGMDGGILTFSLQGRRIVYRRQKKKVQVTLPPNHETAKDRIAIYARAINKISDAVLRDINPLDPGGILKMAEIVKRVEAGF